MDTCTACNKANGTITINDMLLCKACVILMYKPELVAYVSPYSKPVLMSEFDVERINGKLAFTYNKVMKIQL